MKKLIPAVLLFLMVVGPVSALTNDPSQEEGLPAALRCTLAPEKGPCKAMFERFYYDARKEKCLPFFWGGCDGVVPFEAAEECEKACVPPKTLRVQKVAAVNEVYAEVSLEFPKSWEEPNFQVLVDGSEANARNWSGGFSEDRQMASLLFFPGKPGTKRVTVNATVGGKIVSAAASLNWPGRAFIALLGYGGERTLVTAPEPIKIVTANVSNSVIRVNGQTAKPDIAGRQAFLLSFTPAWLPGLNTITVDGKGADGSPVAKAYTFVYSTAGLKEGETALLRYGVEGSKSGPFYSAEVEGDAVVAGSGQSVRAYTLDGDGWLGGEALLVKELKAKKPGTAKIRIFEKPHFLQPKALKEEIAITILPAGK